MKLLNLGCGSRFHKDWTNVDFITHSNLVIQADLTLGIPFKNNTFDVVYHSHVLEHFSKKDGVSFIKECARVLKKSGVIRIAVPDLEKIVVEYLKQLNLAANGKQEASAQYEWIVLELLDQITRTNFGGLIKEYLYSENVSNENYVLQRIGNEGAAIRNSYLNASKNLRPRLSFKKRFIYPVLKFIFGKNFDYWQLGKYRSIGEVHLWMYDRYAIEKLLIESGFGDVKIMSAFDSKIPSWSSYELDGKNDTVFKPDSLFVEAIKK